MKKIILIWTSNLSKKINNTEFNKQFVQENNPEFDKLFVHENNPDFVKQFVEENNTDFNKQFVEEFWLAICWRKLSWFE